VQHIEPEAGLVQLDGPPADVVHQAGAVAHADPWEEALHQVPVVDAPVVGQHIQLKTGLEPDVPVVAFRPGEAA